MKSAGLAVDLYASGNAGKARFAKKKGITSLICSRRDLRSRITKLEWDAKILPQWRLPEVQCRAVDRECNTET